MVLCNLCKKRIRTPGYFWTEDHGSICDLCAVAYLEFYKVDSSALEKRYKKRGRPQK